MRPRAGPWKTAPGRTPVRRPNRVRHPQPWGQAPSTHPFPPKRAPLQRTTLLNDPHALAAEQTPPLHLQGPATGVGVASHLSVPQLPGGCAHASKVEASLPAEVMDGGRHGCGTQRPPAPSEGKGLHITADEGRNTFKARLQEGVRRGFQTVVARPFPS